MLRLLPLVLLIAAGCSDTPDTPATTNAERANALIAQTQSAHRSDSLDGARLSFLFRGTDYSAQFGDDGQRYARSGKDALGPFADTLDARGFRRTRGSHTDSLPPAAALAAEEALNSVLYFALLPRPLTDGAVQPRHLGETRIGDESYQVLDVTFGREGGGRDWQDRFVYWIHDERHTIDYLAYAFHVNGGGIRFRQAFGAREVEGVRVQNYRNFAPTDATLSPNDLERLPQLWRAGRLRHLSDVILDDVRIERPTD